MEMVTYLFKIGLFNFILNAQCGYNGYNDPRIFIQLPDGSYQDWDFTLSIIFQMTESDWDSWLDGTEIKLETIDEVREKCSECGVDWDNFEKCFFGYED